MIEKIDKNQFIEIINKEEQFSIITAFNDITFDSNNKTDDQVYSVQDYYTSDLPFGQKYFILSCLSFYGKITMQNMCICNRVCVCRNFHVTAVYAYSKAFFQRCSVFGSCFGIYGINVWLISFCIMCR